MRIYFARHGESEANILRVHSNRDVPHPLTAKGRGQAMGLARKLADKSVTRLFTSPIMRAVQTAEILSNALDVPYEVTDALREYDCGILEGRADEAAWQQHFAMVDTWIHEGNLDACIEGGESFIDIRDRFVPFIQRLLSDYRSTPANIILMGHGGLYRLMLPLVLVNADYDLILNRPVNYTTCIVAETRTEGLTWIEWKD